MTMTTNHVQGAARQSWKSDNPRAILRLILDGADDPHDRTSVYDKFVKHVLNKGGSLILTNIVDYWFDNNYRSMVRDYPLPGQTEEQIRMERESKRAAAQKEIASRYSKIEAVVARKADEKAVLLLATMMPIGKAFGDCTGSEVRAMRDHLPKAFDAVIAKVGDNVLVRSVFTNKQLGKLDLRLR